MAVPEGLVQLQVAPGVTIDELQMRLLKLWNDTVLKNRKLRMFVLKE